MKYLMKKIKYEYELKSIVCGDGIVKLRLN